MFMKLPTEANGNANWRLSQSIINLFGQYYILYYVFLSKQLSVMINVCDLLLCQACMMGSKWHVINRDW